MTKTLQAFHNNSDIQQQYLTRLETHQKLDEIIKGTYWKDGKGCAVGCTVHSNSHNCYEIELGIPTWFALLEDALFEGMTNVKAKKFPLKLLQSIPLGFSNWQHIYHQLQVFNLEKICKDIDHPIVVKTICDIITLHKKESKDKAVWSAAESEATNVATSAAESTATSAATSAAWSAATSAAKNVATSAAKNAAKNAAWSAALSAAWSAATREAWSATWSAAKNVAWSAALSAAYYDISEELIRLFEENK